jgi:micrococcal nuclease
VYEYDAEITSVYDGDTCTATIDLGFNLFTSKAKLRLVGIDTPEIRTKDPEEKVAGLAARDYLRRRIDGRKVRIQSLKKGKYGRYLAKIWVINEDGTLAEDSVNNELISLGLAKPYMV